MPRGSSSHLRKRPVRQYSVDGIILGEYDCIFTVVSEHKGWNDAGIRKCCLRHGNANSAYGFVWRYVDTDELYELSVEARKSRIRSLLSPRYFPEPIRMYTLFGEYIREFDSLATIQSTFDFCGDRVAKCCKRHEYCNSAFGYVWRYVSDDELFDLSVLERQKLLFVIRKYTKDGAFVDMFDSLATAHHSVKAKLGSGITACCRRKRPTAYEFIWRLASDDEFAGSNIKAMEEWLKCSKSSG